MEAMSQEKLYCSLDIETSGFDPLNNEILEVGFAFFSLGEKSIKITEEWTQVFRPTKLVSPQILALTGISQKELDSAPSFSEHRQFLQGKLKDAVIVGHNIIFDIKFLQSFGINFDGGYIDTLDLAQWILPTHHSYNLENLMHTFKISHKEAHRALADSKAAIKLMEKLLQIYSGFPQKLKSEIKKLSVQGNFLWHKFLGLDLPPLSFSKYSDNGNVKGEKNKTSDLKFLDKTIYNFDLSQNPEQILAEASLKQKILLVLPNARSALNLFKNGLAEETVFLPQIQFDEKKFSKAIESKNLTADEIKFFLKVLVWKFTNWQTKTILDLNLSFFGGQFKNLINGGEILENKSAKVLVTDVAAFLHSAEKKIFLNREVIIYGLNEFELAINASIGSKISWGYINFILKSFFNPELNVGQKEFKEVVEEGLLASDLFFGLVSALLQTDPPSFVNIKISEILNSEKYNKILGAAESYKEKLKKINQVLKSKEISSFEESLTAFFDDQANRVKWIELSENRCGLFNMPLDITATVKNILKLFASVSFVDRLDNRVLPKFFLSRLGLNNYQISDFSKTTDKQKQGDLFSAIRQTFTKKAAINFEYLEQVADEKLILSLISKNKALPAAVLFAGPSQVREFYETNYETLKEKASLLVQNGSGGSNKIFRNFGIHKNSLLLCTDKFILKHLTGQNAVEPIANLSVKTLIICRLPFDQFTHPYQEALAKTFQNAFEDYSLPRALYNFHSLIKFFHSPALKNVFVIDAKLKKPYAKVFKDYLKELV